jgi:hypothetical protein
MGWLSSHWHICTFTNLLIIPAAGEGSFIGIMDGEIGKSPFVGHKKYVIGKSPVTGHIPQARSIGKQFVAFLEYQQIGVGFFLLHEDDIAGKTLLFGIAGEIHRAVHAAVKKIKCLTSLTHSIK